MLSLANPCAGRITCFRVGGNLCLRRITRRVGAVFGPNQRQTYFSFVIKPTRNA